MTDSGHYLRPSSGFARRRRRGRSSGGLAGPAAPSPLRCATPRASPASPSANVVLAHDAEREDLARGVGGHEPPAGPREQVLADVARLDDHLAVVVDQDGHLDVPAGDARELVALPVGDLDEVVARAEEIEQHLDVARVGAVAPPVELQGQASGAADLRRFFERPRSGPCRPGAGLKQPCTRRSEEDARLERPCTRLSEEDAWLERPCTKLSEEDAWLERPCTRLSEEAAWLERPCTKLSEEVARLERPCTKLSEEVARLERPCTKLSEEDAWLERPCTRLDDKGAKLEQPYTKAPSSFRALSKNRRARCRFLGDPPRNRRSARCAHTQRNGNVSAAPPAGSDADIIPHSHFRSLSVFVFSRRTSLKK
jgi:hypothetical protein